MTNREKIAKLLTIKIGNVLGAMGLAGNIASEAGFEMKPNRMENSWKKETGYDDDTYTAAVNNGTYRDIRMNANGERYLATHHKNDNARDAFTYDYIGYSLVQFTWWSLKRDFYDYQQLYAVNHGIPFDIANLEGIIDFVIISSFKYPKVADALINCKDLYDAAKTYCVEYEKPRGYQKEETWSYRARCGYVLFNEVFKGKITTWFDFEGKWYYIENALLVKNRWVEYNGKWFYLGEDGVIKTNSWINYKNEWYFLNNKGEMIESEWKQDDNDWYFCGTDGKMIYNDFIEWQGKKYFLDREGKMAKNCMLIIDGKDCRFNENGELEE